MLGDLIYIIIENNNEYCEIFRRQLYEQKKRAKQDEDTPERKSKTSKSFYGDRYS